MEEEDLNDGEENQLNLNLSSTSSDSSDSTGDERSGLTRDDSSFRRMARVVHRTRNRLDIELNEGFGVKNDLKKISKNSKSFFCD